MSQNFIIKVFTCIRKKYLVLFIMFMEWKLIKIRVKGIIHHQCHNVFFKDIMLNIFSKINDV